MFTMVIFVLSTLVVGILWEQVSELRDARRHSKDIEQLLRMTNKKLLEEVECLEKMVDIKDQLLDARAGHQQRLRRKNRALRRKLYSKSK